MTAPAGVNDGSPQKPVKPVVVTQAEPAAGEHPAEPVATKTAPADAGAEQTASAAVKIAAPAPEPAEADSVETEPADVRTPGHETAEAAAAGDATAGDATAEGEVTEASDAERDMSPIAVIGVILCVIALVGVAVGVLAVLTHGFHKKTVVNYQHRAAAVFSLRPGDCVNTGTGGLTFTRLACSTPHDAEVFASFTLTGSSWPGTTAEQQAAGNGCANRLSGYLNPQLTTAALAQEYIYPDQAAWQVGERTVICEVSSATGKLTGSVRKQP